MRLIFLLVVTAAAIAGVLLLQPIPQDPAYHEFVDNLTIFGIPNFYNVSSSGLIALVALVGVIRSATLNDSHVYLDSRREFGVLFTAALLTGIGSAWYHLEPATATLVWDRLPMSVVFTALLAIVISLYISGVAGKLLFWPLVFAGMASVVYWYRSEQLGMGDLRFYALAQYLSAALIFCIIVMYAGVRKPTVTLFIALVCYAAAKTCEYFDALIYHYSGTISGHSLKHVFAALALFMVFMVLRRKHA